MSRSPLLVVTLVLLAGSLPAQERDPGQMPPRPHEVLVERIERRMEAQRQVLERISGLLETMVGQALEDRIQRVRLESEEVVADVQKQMAAQVSTTQAVRAELQETKEDVAQLRSQNEDLRVELRSLRQELDRRGQVQRDLERELEELRKAVKAGKDGEESGDGDG